MQLMQTSHTYSSENRSASNLLSYSIKTPFVQHQNPVEPASIFRLHILHYTF